MMISPRFRLIICTATLTLVFASASAQTDSTKQDPSQETIKIRTELVVLDTHIVDKRSRETIRGLKPADFELFEDGVKQQIEYFSQDKLPLSIVLLVDISPSVRPVIEKIREGALAALQKLKPEDEVALMVFSGWTELLQDFTKDRPLILEKLKEGMDKKGGGTRIHEAVARAARQMRYATNPNSRRVIIVVTDNQGAMLRRGDSVSEEEVRQAVADSGATVCGLIVRSLLNVVNSVFMQHPQIQESIKITSVNPYAEQTGGEMSGASKDEVNVRLGEMLEHLRSRYSIGYVPANQNFDGKFRHIKLALSPETRKRLGGDISIRTKQGYYALDKESEEILAEVEAKIDEKTDSAKNEAQPGNNPSDGPRVAEKKTDNQNSNAAPGQAPGNSTTPPAEKSNNPATAENNTTVNDPKAVEQWREAFRNAFRRKPANPYANMQMLDVLAVNKKTGAIVENLTLEDFEIDDQGTKREIAHFSHGQAPISVILLVDVSGRTPMMMSSLRRNVAQWLRALKPQDEIALMAFGASAALIQDFTKDHKLIAGKFRDYIETARKQNVGYGQQRSMAVFQAAEHMDKAANSAGRRVIITITDDAQQFSLPMESVPAVELLLDSGTTVYAMVAPAEKPSQLRRAARSAAYGAIVGLGNPVSILTQVVTQMAMQGMLDTLLKDRAFGQIIQKTGGAAVKVSGDAATENLVLLLNRVHNRYLVGFAPGVVNMNASNAIPPQKVVKDVTKHDRYRPVQLKLSPAAKKRTGEVAIVAPPGYFARKVDGAVVSDGGNNAGNGGAKNQK